MNTYPIRGMETYHRRTISNWLLGRRRRVGPETIGDRYEVSIPENRNTVTVSLNKTRKSSSSDRYRSSSDRYRSSNRASTLRELERERRIELCKLLQVIEKPDFDQQNGRIAVIINAVRFLTRSIMVKYPLSLYKKPHLYYNQISDYIINTIDENKQLNVQELMSLAKNLGLYKKCGIKITATRKVSR